MVAHTFNPRIWNTEAKGSLLVKDIGLKTKTQIITFLVANFCIFKLKGTILSTLKTSQFSSFFSSNIFLNYFPNDKLSYIFILYAMYWFFINALLIFILCVWVFCLGILHVHQIHIVLTLARGWCQIPWNRTFRQLWAAV